MRRLGRLFKTLGVCAAIQPYSVLRWSEGLVKRAAGTFYGQQ